ECFLLHFQLEDLMEQRLKARLGTLQRHPRLEPAERLREAATAIVETVERPGRQFLLHHHGHADLGRVPGLDAIESCLAGSYDRDRISVEHQLLAQDIGAAGEAGLPVTVAQHGLRMAALIQVVLGGEDASQRSADAEYGEVVAAYELARDQFGLSLIAHAECGSVPAEHALEDSVLIAEVLIHRWGDAMVSR